MLSSPTTVKVTGNGAQIHHMSKNWNPSGENQKVHQHPQESSQYSEYQYTSLEGLKSYAEKSRSIKSKSMCPTLSFWGPSY